MELIVQPSIQEFGALLIKEFSGSRINNPLIISSNLMNMQMKGSSLSRLAIQKARWSPIENTYS